MTVLNLVKGHVSVDEAQAKVELIDLKQVAYHLMNPSDPESTAWSLAKTEVLINAYRNFLALRLVLPEADLIPTFDVDKVWHCHILTNTIKYGQDCISVFGDFLHHQSFGMQTDEQRSEIRSKQLLTSEIFYNVFGSSFTNPFETRSVSGSNEFKLDCCSPTSQPGITLADCNAPSEKTNFVFKADCCSPTCQP